VIMDIGHGAGSFSFEVAEALLAAGRRPDVISTDAHQLSVRGPMFDLPTCMSKFLALGRPLAEVVRAATSRPAEVLGLGSELGTLRPGAFAEYIALPATNVWRHEPGIDLEVAAIFDPFGNAVHTALTFPVLGEDVLITGAGPIGSSCTPAATATLPARPATRS